MEENTTAGIPNENGEEELTHSDKIIGIITEPVATFEKTAKFPPRTIDWLLPIILLLVIISLTRFIELSNPNIYFSEQQKQTEQMQKVFNQMVANGKMTKEQAQEQMDKAQDRMEKSKTPVGYIFQFISIIIFGFIVFFIVAAVFFLFSKFIFKGDGNYSSALVVNGLTAYIGIIEVIIAAILSFAFGRMIHDVSIASIAQIDKSTFAGFIFSKLNVITIWSFIVVSIGLAKMFKSSSTVKYYIMVFGLWIGWSILIWGLTKAIPFLGFFGG
jgi:hypothetical protein